MGPSREAISQDRARQAIRRAVPENVARKGAYGRGLENQDVLTSEAMIDAEKEWGCLRDSAQVMRVEMRNTGVSLQVRRLHTREKCATRKVQKVGEFVLLFMLGREFLGSREYEGKAGSEDLILFEWLVS
jgi:hypothetical protein